MKLNELNMMKNPWVYNMNKVLNNLNNIYTIKSYTIIL